MIRCGCLFLSDLDYARLRPFIKFSKVKMRVKKETTMATDISTIRWTARRHPLMAAFLVLTFSLGVSAQETPS